LLRRTRRLPAEPRRESLCAPETLYENVYVRSPYIHTAADKDPAWRVAEKDDRLPESFPAWTQAAAPAKVEG
jgi:hypothetical protein